MKKQILLTAITVGALAWFVGFACGAILTKPERDKVQKKIDKIKVQHLNKYTDWLIDSTKKSKELDKVRLEKKTLIDTLASVMADRDRWKECARFFVIKLNDVCSLTGAEKIPVDADGYPTTPTGSE